MSFGLVSVLLEDNENVRCTSPCPIAIASKTSLDQPNRGSTWKSRNNWSRIAAEYIPSATRQAGELEFSTIVGQSGVICLSYCVSCRPFRLAVLACISGQTDL